MKKFKAIDKLIPQLGLNMYRNKLLRSTDDFDWFNKTIDGVGYTIVWTNGIGQVAGVEGKLSFDERLKYDLWLFGCLDKDQSKLAKYLEIEFGTFLDCIDLDIYDYIDLMVELYEWLHLTYSEPVDLINFNTCTIPYICDTIALINTISCDKLVKRIKRTNGFPMYMGSDDNVISAVLANSEIPVFKETLSGLEMTPDYRLYADYTGKPVDKTFKLHRKMNVDSTYIARLILDVFGSINRLRSKPYVFTGVNTNAP